MKTTDLKIIQHIRRNSRISLTTLSRKTGIPVSTIFDRIRSQQQHLITRFTTLVDFAKIGFPVRVHIMLKSEAQERDGLRKYLLAHERVNNIYRINNGYDYATECLFSSIKEVEEFIETIEHQFKIVDKHVFHIIDEVAREKMMALQYE